MAKEINYYVSVHFTNGTICRPRRYDLKGVMELLQERGQEFVKLYVISPTISKDIENPINHDTF
jgi:hypothetical protein